VFSCRWWTRAHHGAHDHNARRHGGIAGFDDLIEFFKRASPDKQFCVMPGISRQLQRKLPDGLPSPRSSWRTGV
jgi:hypothetical protein